MACSFIPPAKRARALSVWYKNISAGCRYTANIYKVPYASLSLSVNDKSNNHLWEGNVQTLLGQLDVLRSFFRNNVASSSWSSCAGESTLASCSKNGKLCTLNVLSTVLCILSISQRPQKKDVPLCSLSTFKEEKYLVIFTALHLNLPQNQSTNICKYIESEQK